MSIRDFLFFFFQAEDGIRDIGVTGVQTCALPISHLGAALLDLGDQRAVAGVGGVGGVDQGGVRARGPGAVKQRLVAARSEERRGGKECRSRWSPYHLKKKRSNTTAIFYTTHRNN